MSLFVLPDAQWTHSLLHMRINFILCSRNDNYCGRPLDRLQISLRHNLKILDKYKSWKITVVDWGSEIKIEDEIGLKDPRIVHKYVPRSITNKFRTPFSEVHSLNYAARISCADFIGRLDQDTMIGDRFANWFFESPGLLQSEMPKENWFASLLFKKRIKVNPHCFYFCKRTDLKPGVVDPCGESSLNAPLDYEPWKCAVGIFLVPTSFWHESTGYNEKNIHFNHMEHEFIFR